MEKHHMMNLSFKNKRNNKIIGILLDANKTVSRCSNSNIRKEMNFVFIGDYAVNNLVTKEEEVYKY